MNALLSISRVIDALSVRIGKVLSWIVLAMVLISAANAIVRKAFNYSSNAYLEIQWYLFAAVFLLGAGYTLLNNQHVRIDIISTRLSARARNWIDVVGIIICLWPMAFIIMWLSWPLLADAYTRHEVSSNAGGLIIWPARLLVPLGFFLLILQSVSELIKRIAFLAGRIPDPLDKHGGRSAEEDLAEEMARERGVKLGDAT